MLEFFLLDFGTQQTPWFNYSRINFNAFKPREWVDIQLIPFKAFVAETNQAAIFHFLYQSLFEQITLIYIEKMSNRVQHFITFEVCLIISIF